MTDVFISYKSKNLETIENIVTYLENDGLTCYFAKTDNHGGYLWGGELVRAIKNSRLLVFFFSSAANEEPKNVRKEIKKAFDEDIPILTVLLDDCKPIDDLDYFLSDAHYLECYPNPINTYLPEISRTIKDLLDGNMPNSQKTKKALTPSTVFSLDKEAGHIINPVDNQRNVSFRTDTFMNMMGGIYDKITAFQSVEDAQRIFFDIGYESGENFADRVHNQWGNKFTFDEIQNKIKKWCEFDSAVGWGAFDADISFDEENDELTGTLTITDAFIVDKKNKRRVCEFIKGYCTGVLDVLVGDCVELVCRSCPLEKRLNQKCVFDIKMKG